MACYMDLANITRRVSAGSRWRPSVRLVAILGQALAPESFLKNPVIILYLILRLAGSTCALPESRQFDAACDGEKKSSLHRSLSPILYCVR